MKKKFLYPGLALVVLAVIFIGYKMTRSSEQTITLESAKIGRGNIRNTVTATGTLEAIKTVDVGTQVSGVIEKLYVDFNSEVKKGQLLAQLDETPLLAQLDQSKSSVDQAEAQVNYQKATFDRYKVLVSKKLIAQSDFDLAEYNYKNAIASLKNAQSVYSKNKINLSYARIYSPIDGIILNRAVDEGQTVAASFNTPTLFKIANDLTQMRVEAKVDEADIGKVVNGQRVEFTVDAYPLRKFEGSVTEIRLQPVSSANVITYTVIISAPNPDKKLMPGMTANASFYVTERNNILVVPSKAVQFNPDQNTLATYMEKHNGSNMQGMTPPAGAPEVAVHAGVMMPEAADAMAQHEEDKTVWIKDGEMIHPKRVKVGVTDEINYEILSGLNEGEEVVTALVSTGGTATTGTKAAKSPFMPTRPGANRTTTKTTGSPASGQRPPQ